jgi:biopolymer transport protein ExbD
MLDMAFQLLAFFILTFQPPGREARIDLDLPAAPAALPAAPRRAAERRVDADLTIRAAADAAGRLRALRLGATPLTGPDTLTDLLRQHVTTRAGRPLSVALVADEALLYDEAARLIGACSSAGVAAIRLAAVPASRRPTTGEAEP